MSIAENAQELSNAVENLRVWVKRWRVGNPGKMAPEPVVAAEHLLKVWDGKA